MPATNEAPATWLTQGAYDRLKAELEELIAHRPVLAAEIHARREEGDLRENGGYHAAKEEQGKQEARIRQVESLLRNARVGKGPQNADAVTLGTVVTVQFNDVNDTETFLLGSREISATTSLDVYSPESALGAAILGKKPGEEATYLAPNGSRIKVKVLDLKAFTG